MSLRGKGSLSAWLKTVDINHLKPLNYGEQVKQFKNLKAAHDSLLGAEGLKKKQILLLLASYAKEATEKEKLTNHGFSGLSMKEKEDKKLKAEEDFALQLKKERNAVQSKKEEENIRVFEKKKNSRRRKKIKGGRRERVEAIS